MGLAKIETAPRVALRIFYSELNRTARVSSIIQQLRTSKRNRSNKMKKKTPFMNSEISGTNI
jgi:hypothetical protein